MTLSVQFYTMLAMIIMGSFFGASLDTYQRFLKRASRKRLIVFINDILFWLIHGLITFYVLYLVNYGEIRFYLILALLCGFSAYQALIKRIYLKMLEKVILFVKGTALFLYKLFLFIIYRPIKWIILLLLGLLMFIGKILYTLVKISGKVLLWIMKIIFYPIILIGKGIGKILPDPVKNFINKISMHFAGFFKLSKNEFIRVIKWIRHIFQK